MVVTTHLRGHHPANRRTTRSPAARRLAGLPRNTTHAMPDFDRGAGFLLPELTKGPPPSQADDVEVPEVPGIVIDSHEAALWRKARPLVDRRRQPVAPHRDDMSRRRSRATNPDHRVIRAEPQLVQRPIRILHALGCVRQVLQFLEHARQPRGVRGTSGSENEHEPREPSAMAHGSVSLPPDQDLSLHVVAEQPPEVHHVASLEDHRPDSATEELIQDELPPCVLPARAE